MKKAQQKRRPPGRIWRAAEIGDAARRHRLDRFEHHRSVATRTRALSRRGGDSEPQRRRAGASGARTRRAFCSGRRCRSLQGIKGRARRLRHRSCRRRRRLGRGRAAAGRLGHGGDHRRRQPEADARCGRTRRDRCARQQGMPGLRRRLVHAPRGRGRSDSPAGRFRAQRGVPGADVGPSRRSASRHPDRLRRAVPHLVTGAIAHSDGRAGAQASDLDHGAKGHDRFRDTDEQRPRADRGASFVRDCRPTSSTSSCTRSRSCTAWSNSATAR